jgi:hypothetical protein
MNTEQERAEFEAWCDENEYDRTKRLDGTGYNNEKTKRAWAAWQAGRAALAAQAHEAAPSNEHVSVVGMPEFDALLDHIYEHGTTSEGVVIRADALARALLSRYGRHAGEDQDACDKALNWLSQHAAPAKEAMAQPAADKFIATFRCKSNNGLVAYTDASIHSVSIHDDGVVEVVIDHWPERSASVGEEIMVNAAHDVFTLPLQPSGLSSGPRFVVHVPAPEQQQGETGALALLSRMRFACGDNGTRMQDELEQYLRDLKRDAERYRNLRRKVCIVGDSFHVINIKPTYIAPDAAIELDSAIDAAIDAAIKEQQQ